MRDGNTASSSSGVGIGSVIAVVWSWVTNHSVLWCIVHGLFGWGYAIYRLLGFGGAE